jgi:hypothetical protein
VNPHVFIFNMVRLASKVTVELCVFSIAGRIS